MSTLGTRMTSLDATTLKLHTAPDGTVWFADGTHAPIASGLSIEEFVDTIRNRQHPFVRILGASINAKLATAVWPLCRNGGRLQVASPTICESAAELVTPEVALYRTRQVCLTSSLGGWHDFTTSDYSSYALVTRIQKDGDVSQAAVEILKHHPAWCALKFIRGVSDYWAAWVLRFIVDPRWFINPEYPDRIGRLRSFLGLRPSTQRAITCDGSILTGAAQIRCRAVRNAWKSRMPRGVQWEDPQNFLWRIWRSAGEGSNGDLKASQKFLIFLRHTWLDAMQRNTTSGVRGPLFLPDMLLHGDREIDAFQRYMESASNPV
jgi:hypothetical protein